MKTRVENTSFTFTRQQAGDISGLHYIIKDTVLICCEVCHPDPYNPTWLFAMSGHCANQGGRYRPSSTSTISTTTTLQFANQFVDDLTAVVSAFVPFGSSAIGIMQGNRGVVGGTSAVSPSQISKDMEKEILSSWANVSNIPGAELLKPVSIATGFVSLANATSFAQMDLVVEGFFRFNNLPTSHTVLTHNGQPDTTAMALFTAQMSAAYQFLLDNAWYFFTDIWAGNTLHTLDQALVAGSNSIAGLVDAWLVYLEHRFIQGDRTLNINYRNALASDLRFLLNDFEKRANFVNVMFMATIAQATCGVMSNIPATPPALTEFSDQLTQQSQSDLIQTHRNARQARDAAWLAYQDETRPHRIEGARQRFEAARALYEDASRAVGLPPTPDFFALGRLPEESQSRPAQQQPPPPPQQPPNSGLGLDQPVEPEPY